MSNNDIETKIDFVFSIAHGFFGAQMEQKEQDFHREFLKVAITNKFSNIIGFRGCAKSTFISLFLLICDSVFYFEPYTILIKETEDLAKESFDNILDALEQLKKNKSIGLSITSSARIITLCIGSKRMVIRVSSKGEKLRGALRFGKRPTRIVMDDFDSVDNILSESERKKNKDKIYREILKLLDPKGTLTNVGNFLHAESVAAILESDKRFATVKVPILNEDNNSVWNERFPTSEVFAEWQSYKDMGLDTAWQMEMMCRVVDDENAVFNLARVAYYDINEIDFGAMLTFITADLASTDGIRSDFTAFAIVSIDFNMSTMYVRDIIRGRWSADTDKAAKALLEAFKLYKPIKVGVENKSECRGFISAVNSVGRENNIYIPIELLKISHAKDSKVSRILGLQSPLLQRQIIINKNMQNLMAFENELREFPYSKHDDMLDALSHSLQYFDKFGLNSSEYGENYQGAPYEVW